MHKLAGCLVALVITAAGSEVVAQGKVDNIGNAGGIVVGAERLAGVYRTIVTTKASLTQVDTIGTVRTQSDVEETSTSIAVFGHDPQAPTQIPRLALDVFVRDGLSVGASFIYMRVTGEFEGERRTSFGTGTDTLKVEGDQATRSALIVHPRIGYAIAFNEFFGIWPRVGFSYNRYEVAEEDTRDPARDPGQDFPAASTVTFMSVPLEGLIFVSPFSNFAVVGGPFVDIGFDGTEQFESGAPAAPNPTADTTLTAFGFMAGIAGYFDTQ